MFFSFATAYANLCLEASLKAATDPVKAFTNSTAVTATLNVPLNNYLVAVQRPEPSLSIPSFS